MIGWILLVLIIILSVIVYRAVKIIQRQMAMIQLQKTQINILKEIIEDYKNFLKGAEPKLDVILEKAGQHINANFELKKELEKLDKKLVEKETLISAYLMKDKQ